MKIKIPIVLLSLAAAGCSTVPKGYKLSEFSYNNKFHNSYIASRIPDYGDGHADGCLIMREMYLSLSDAAGKLVHGIISDVTSKEPLHYAKIVIYFHNHPEPLQIKSDSLGHFEFYNNSKLSLVNVNCPGYRGLAVNFMNDHPL